MGTATVQSDGNGGPCFGIESTDATRDGRPMLQSVTVSTQGNAQAPSYRVWSFMVEPGQAGLALANGQCVSYGKIPNGMRTLAEPMVLRPGVVYVVSLGVRLTDANDPTQAYQRQFCLVPGASTPRVHELQWDAAGGKWLSAPCLGPSASDR